MILAIYLLNIYNGRENIIMNILNYFMLLTIRLLIDLIIINGFRNHF
jgi:hypothetical protein